MLTQEENALLTQVGPGTPGGNLLRRYWHPIRATAQLDDNPVQPVRILGEDVNGIGVGSACEQAAVRRSAAIANTREREEAG